MNFETPKVAGGWKSLCPFSNVRVIRQPRAVGNQCDSGVRRLSVLTRDLMSFAQRHPQDEAFEFAIAYIENLTRPCTNYSELGSQKVSYIYALMLLPHEGVVRRRI